MGEPFERTAELSRAVAAIERGAGVLVVGPHGSGRSRLLREIVAALGADARARLWVGEDAHGLDAGAARKLVDAVAAQKLVLLASALDHRPIPGPLAALWKDESIVRIELGAFRPNELLDIAEGLLGAPIAAETVPRLIPRRGGLDLAALREVLRVAEECGALQIVGGSWTITAAIHPSEALRQLLQSRAARPDDENGIGACAATLLDVIALAPEISLGPLVEVLTALGFADEAEAELERLEEQGIVELVGGPREPGLRVRDGVCELHLPTTLGGLRRRRLLGAIVDVLGAHGSEHSPAECVSFATHSLALARSIDASTLIRAARLSLRSRDTELSLTLAAAAVTAGGGFDAEMVLASAELELGRSGEALARLEVLAASAENDLQQQEALSSLMWHLHERSGFRPAVVDAASAFRSDDPAERMRSNAFRGFVLFSLDDPVGAAALLEPALEVLDEDDLAAAHFIVANAAFIEGRLARAAASLDTAEALLIASGADTSRVQMLRASVIAAEGRIAESLTTVRAFRDAAAAFGQAVPQAMCSWAAGVLLGFMGRAAEAAAELSAAVETMDRVDLRGTVLLVRTELATALASSGDPAAARSALEPALQPGDSGLRFEGQVRQAEAWIALAEGRTDDAVAAMLRAADHHSSHGHSLVAVLALRDVARFGAARSVLPRLEALSAEVEGRYPAVSIELSRALAAAEALRDGDEVDIAALSRRFDDVGRAAGAMEAHMLAAEAFEGAAECLRLDGRPRDAAAAARLRDQHAALCGVRPLVLGPVDGAGAVLSDREREIAVLAAAGRTNREIAIALVLSVRTVETHLQRVYRKLGLRTRAQIADALSS